MPVKTAIGDNILSQNEYEFRVGTQKLTVISVGDFDVNLETVTLPDRSVVTGGSTQAFEVDVVVPTHHASEMSFWEQWFKDSQFHDSVSAAPNYKKTVTIIQKRTHTGTKSRAIFLSGVFPRKRMDTGLDMENEGDMARTTWTLSVDQYRSEF